ncbi:MAG: adenylosuccinate lyase family protein [Alphaproteobacteria bacterium]|jgi:adenylosuccinate lyase|nr:adenylosuccinate lyase family protein [Alphaproteobacteria bacterium]
MGNRALYDSQSKSLDDRGIAKLLTRKAKVASWLKVEATLALAQAEVGIIPQTAAKNIAENCNIDKIDFAEMDRIMANIGHGFVPFLKVLINQCSPEGGKYVHYGITTQNIQQTGQLYILKQVNNIFKSFIADILTNLSALAKEHTNTVMAGRTHGKHAIPITFGYKVSVWISELLHSVERLQESEKRVFSVMMGGAVGSFNSMGSLGVRVQDIVAKELKMSSMIVPSRAIQSHKEEYIMNLALLCNALHKMAEEVYYTGIEEFGELSEGFKKGTIGSSTMPQKINPKNAKGIIANSQKLYSTLTSGLFSSVRLFEGDSSSYMLFDVLLEEAVELTTEVLIRAEELTRTLTVNKKRMYQNVLLSKGLDNSEYVMMCLAEKLGKDKAHTLVYDTVMQVRDGKEYLEALKENSEISAMFSVKEIEDMLKPENYVGIGNEIAHKMATEALKISKILKE